ncbi:MAG: DapH/DapD/GlmU-related protein [Candidatus Woykebacteria bacterium]
MVKRLIKIFLIFTGQREQVFWGVHNVPLSILVVNFIFQRISRINSSCKWPVHFTSTVLAPDKIKIGRGVAKSFAQSSNCYITGFNHVEISDDTIFAPGVGIISANHNPINHEQTKELPIKIGKNCWLGMNSIILPGVELGDNVVVAAGSVVNKSFPSNVVIAGVPAAVKKQIDREK